MLEICRCYFNK